MTRSLVCELGINSSAGEKHLKAIARERRSSAGYN
jgi:hypothetical protein